MPMKCPPRSVRVALVRLSHAAYAIGQNLKHTSSARIGSAKTTPHHGWVGPNQRRRARVIQPGAGHAAPGAGRADPWLRMSLGAAARLRDPWNIPDVPVRTAAASYLPIRSEERRV